MKYSINIVKKVYPIINEFITNDNTYYIKYCCSNCGCVFDPSIGVYHYCPQCGNKIDWKHDKPMSKEFQSLIDKL